MKKLGKRMLSEKESVVMYGCSEHCSNCSPCSCDPGAHPEEGGRAEKSQSFSTYGSFGGDTTSRAYNLYG